MLRNETEGAGLTAVDRAELGIANTNRFLQHGSEHRLKITGRTADDLEHFGCCRLLLVRLVEFAIKPSDLCILDRGRRGSSFGRIAALWITACAAF